LGVWPEEYFEHVLPKLSGEGRVCARERGSLFIFINYIRGRNDLSFGFFFTISKNDMIFCLVFFIYFKRELKVADDDNHKKSMSLQSKGFFRSCLFMY